MRPILRLLLVAVLAGAGSLPARAQPAGATAQVPQASGAPAQVQQASMVAAPGAPGVTPPPAWSFSLTPYVWLPALGGTVHSPLPRLDDQSFALGSGTVFTDLSTVPVMVAGEARYGRFALVGDFFYAGLTQDIRVGRDLLFDGGHVRTISTFGTILGMVRVIESPAQNLEIGGGARIWNFNTKLSLNPGLVSGVIQKSSISWADPLLSARYTAALSPALGITVYGDIGGFDAGSRLTWQVLGSVDYSLTAATQLRAGWRYLSVDKTRGSTGLDLSFNGPFFAATFRF